MLLYKQLYIITLEIQKENNMSTQRPVPDKPKEPTEPTLPWPQNPNDPPVDKP